MPRRLKDTEWPNILFSCYAQKSSEGEQFIPQHVLGYCISGRSEIFVGGKTYVFNPGEYKFFRKNQLARYIKYPPPGGEFRSVSIIMQPDTLQSIRGEQNLSATQPYKGENVLQLQPHPLLVNYMESITPYLEGINELSTGLTTQKVKEAIMILLEIHPALKDLLFDFSEPGKIDLEAYMNEHYKFNVHLDRFAYLTGRSLATFKRDFEKIFHMSPSRWLQQRRLSEAYYLIKEKGRRASDVYLELGFEDLSHFSFAFKKNSGVAPSLVAS